MGNEGLECARAVVSRVFQQTFDKLATFSSAAHDFLLRATTQLFTLQLLILQPADIPRFCFRRT
jgi:hypothetical protein